MSTPLKFYVYELHDSRDSSIFYIGKGCGNRSSQHVINVKASREPNLFKHERIAEIYAGGGTVIEKKIAEGLNEDDAFKMERARIIEIGLENLTNIKPGILSQDERDELLARRVLRNALDNFSLGHIGQNVLERQWLSVIFAAHSNWPEYKREVALTVKRENIKMFIDPRNPDGPAISRADALRFLAGIKFMKGIDIPGGKLVLRDNMLWEKV